MSDERNESRRRLLDDVLREGLAGAQSDKEAAITAFRRGRLWRRVRRVSLTALFVAAATVGVLVIQPDAAKEGPLGASAHVQPPERSDMPTLTDEELIASFPSNSCFLAEVEGRQILVFVDPRVEEKVLRKGTAAFARNP